MTNSEGGSAPAADLIPAAVNFFKTRGTDRVTWLSRVFKIEVQEFADKKTLEIGCGFGEVTAALAELSADPLGIDCDDTFERGPFRDLKCFCKIDDSFEGLTSLGNFDFIASFDWLQHIENPNRVIAALPALLKPGGQAFFKFGLYRGPSASYLTNKIRIPWLRLIYSEAEIGEMLKSKTGINSGVRWVNKWTHLNYLDMFRAAGLEFKVTYKEVKIDLDFYKQHYDQLKAYPIEDLQKDYMQVHVTGRGEPISDGPARRVRALLSSIAEEVQQTADQKELLDIGAELRAAKPQIEGLLPGGSQSGILTDLRSGAQSRHFMIDLLPYIQSYINTFPKGMSFNVLDVGAASGAGSELLGSLYNSKRYGYSMKVTALDIRENFAPYLIASTKYVDFIKEDIFKLNRRYDIVICSHVIEHVRQPQAFCERLQQICVGRVFVATPFEESTDQMTKGHLHSFDQAFIDRIRPLAYRTQPSHGWGFYRQPQYHVLIMELEGLANRPAAD